MSRYLAFKLEVGAQIPKWYLSESKPKDPYIKIEIGQIWGNALGAMNQHAKLTVIEGKITNIAIVGIHEDFDEMAKYISLHDIFGPKTEELPTQPLE
jgi:hypothetical protein